METFECPHHECALSSTTQHGLQILLSISHKMSRVDHGEKAGTSSKHKKMTVPRALRRCNKRMKRQILNEEGERSSGEPFTN